MWTWKSRQATSSGKPLHTSTLLSLPLHQQMLWNLGWRDGPCFLVHAARQLRLALSLSEASWFGARPRVTASPSQVNPLMKWWQSTCWLSWRRGCNRLVESPLSFLWSGREMPSACGPGESWSAGADIMSLLLFGRKCIRRKESRPGRNEPVKRTETMGKIFCRWISINRTCKRKSTNQKDYIHVSTKL